MDLTFWRSAVTVVSLALFLGIAVWACSGRNKTRFDEAAQVPFADD
ncbi:MAG: CcoQ/FixQ family Cbb3-type cytochrome c oxidase assembly chaperone [Rubrivivax sp.]|nr:MAG: CcoQ/FixQ family Cbb3-type cytochrome c oxidase assembly chaperone [Rubrivivax sp.]